MMFNPENRVTTSRSVQLVEPSSQPPRPAQVFVSHSNADATLVDWVAAQVEAVGLHPYLAERDVQAGRPLTEKVRDEIAGSAALLVVLTGQADASRYVQQEIGAAVQCGRRVIALVEHEVAHTSFAMIEGIEHIRFDSANLAALSADLTVALLQVEKPQQSVPPPAMIVNAPRQALTVQFQAELSLTAGQVFFGVFLVLLVVGCIYVATRPPSQAQAGDAEPPPTEV